MAAVFETPEPYSARTLDSTDLAGFFTRRPLYRADSARMADFYARRNMQFAWIVRDSLTASADAFIALSGMEGYGVDDRQPECDSCAVESERFQARYGLETDGVIGPAFLRELNVPPAERLRTMLVNIQRLRWLPETQPANALLVNIPEFRLHVFEGDDVAFSMRIVVGAAATIFADTLTQVVMSPTWTLPMSITRNEILPALAKNPNYLRTHNMEIVGGSKAAPVIRQKPGPDNALGRVQFLFPNRFDIYMHDTPARGAFALEKRAFSHGCIRLAEPRELAEYLLRDNPAWTPERIGTVMLGGRETTVEVRNPRPVFIVYFTA